jgi:hypothetical protein
MAADQSGIQTSNLSVTSPTSRPTALYSGPHLLFSTVQQYFAITANCKNYDTSAILFYKCCIFVTHFSVQLTTPWGVTDYGNWPAIFFFMAKCFLFHAALHCTVDGSSRQKLACVNIKACKVAALASLNCWKLNVTRSSFFSFLFFLNEKKCVEICIVSYFQRSVTQTAQQRGKSSDSFWTWLLGHWVCIP